jgi:16S rRNA (adenine1518-N6/adenine1519-N6)-dimethyltransferase
MDIKPKKSLGQNFLRDERILDQIISASDIQPDDFVIEIGPGEGVLTEKIAQKAGKVLAIEIDDRLVPELQEKFAAQKNVEIIHTDILNIQLKDLLSPTQKYKVIANLPYYITSPIIRLFLESVTAPESMILMVQKEVAERIVATAGQMSILSVSVQYYATAELLFPVSKNAFFPVPQVDSAVIRITPVASLEKRDTDEVKKFFSLVRAGFSAKRKTLVNNLANSLHLEKAVVEEKLKTVPLKGTARAQELTLADWKKLPELF